MFRLAPLFRNDMSPTKPRRAAPFSLGGIAFVLAVIAIAVPASQAAAAGAWCTSPYIQVAGAGTVPTGDASGELTIQRVNIGEPFDGSCNNKSITFVEKVNTLDPGNTGTVTPIYNAQWTVRFSVPDTNGTPRTLFVVWNTTTVPTGEFSYGFVDTSTGQTVNRTFICAPPAITCPVTGTVAPDGSIAMTLTTSVPLTFTPQVGSAFIVNLGNPGTILSSIQGVTYLCACAAGSGVVFTESTSNASQNYTLQGNVSCSNPPVAALAASTNSGNAPLTVNFDASGSNIPAGGCGTINSYIFDFGDSTGATQSTPTVSHTYNSAGLYAARVTVTSSVGLTSTNNAEQDITVNSPLPPALSSIVSRVNHAGTDFDILLPQPPAVRGVECRSGGTYKMIFTFVNNLVNPAAITANITTGIGLVSGTLAGPGANQYTVTLSGVTNIQYITVTLNNVLDSSGASGAVTGTMGVLIGDATGNGIVSNAGDVNAVKAQVSLPVTASNFRDDINANGVISNSGDVALTKAQVSTALAPAP